MPPICRKNLQIPANCHPTARSLLFQPHRSVTTHRPGLEGVIGLPFNRPLLQHGSVGTEDQDFPLFEGEFGRFPGSLYSLPPNLERRLDLVA